MAVCLLLTGTAYAGPPQVTADAAVLLDWVTGVRLYDKAADVRRHPASTTKIVTALVCLEYGNLTDVVKVSPLAASLGGASMKLDPGDRFTLDQLLTGLLMVSGNDAALAIAEHVAGSQEGFARLMNIKARELGCTNSHFINPHGFTAKGHMTTAYDLALLAREALRNRHFAAIVRTREELVAFDRDQRMLRNTNRLLWSFEGAEGVKTGTTDPAGKCLVAAATRDGHRLIAVVMHSDDRFADAARLLDWGFDSSDLSRPLLRGQTARTVPVSGGAAPRVTLVAVQDLAVVVPAGQTAELSLVVPTALKAPVEAGELYGWAVATVGGVPAGTVALAAAEAVQVRPQGWLIRLAKFIWVVLASARIM